jgi:hypothetical protein
MLEGRAAERSRRLEDAVGMQLFNNGVKSLLQWVEEVKSGLNTNEHVRYGSVAFFKRFKQDGANQPLLSLTIFGKLVFIIF